MINVLETDCEAPLIAVQGHRVILKIEIPGGAGNGLPSGSTIISTTAMTPRVARHLAKQLNLCASAAEEDEDEEEKS